MDFSPIGGTDQVVPLNPSVVSWSEGFRSSAPTPEADVELRDGMAACNEEVSSDFSVCRGLPGLLPAIPSPLSAAGGTGSGKQEIWARSGLGAVALDRSLSCSVLAPSLGPRSTELFLTQPGLSPPFHESRKTWAEEPGSCLRVPRRSQRSAKGQEGLLRLCGLQRQRELLNTLPPHHSSFGQQGLLGRKLSSVFEGPHVMSERFPKLCAPETLATL